MDWFLLVLGLWAGAFCGVFCMGLMVMARDRREQSSRRAHPSSRGGR